MEIPNNCINCGEQLTGNFCSNCGQRRRVNRLSLKTFFEDYLSRLFGMDTNFLRTLRDLTISPGKVGKTFVEGNRVKYIGPVGYFFLISTFFILEFSFLGVDIKEFMSATSESFAASPKLEGEEAKLQSTLMEFVSNNFKIIGFLIIPFLAFWGKVLFRKSKLNLFEHSVNALYVEGHMIFIQMIGLLLYKWTNVLFNQYFLFINIAYFIWSCFGFYKQKGFKTVLKGGALYLFAYISFFLFFILVTLTGFIIYKKFIVQ